MTETTKDKALLAADGADADARFEEELGKKNLVRWCTEFEEK